MSFVEWKSAWTADSLPHVALAKCGKSAARAWYFASASSSWTADGSRLLAFSAAIEPSSLGAPTVAARAWYLDRAECPRRSHPYGANPRRNVFSVIVLGSINWIR